MSDTEAACWFHNSPWPCVVNNSSCQKVTDPRLVQAALKVYRKLGPSK